MKTIWDLIPIDSKPRPMDQTDTQDRSRHGGPNRAMVLAAGLGTRMRPLTLTRPKPLISVAGTPLIDRGLDRLADAGVETAVVNVHHMAEQIEDHLRTRTTPRIVFSDERDQLLETGGGVAKALPLLGSAPFFLLNSDSFYVEDGSNNLNRLAARWDDTAMDILLLLAEKARSFGYDGKGDFCRAPSGRLKRRPATASTALVYTGVGILHPRLFGGAPKGAFSLNVLFDAAIAAGRLYGELLAGTWIHVGTPEAIGSAETVVDKLLRTQDR